MFANRVRTQPNRFTDFSIAWPALERLAILAEQQWIEQTAYAFLSELDLTGTAMPGTIIYYGILTKESNGWNIWERGSTKVGDSGLVQEKISLPKIGWQYIAVFVQQGGTIYGCVYPVKRMSRQLESELRNLRMNLYEVCTDSHKETS